MRCSVAHRVGSYKKAVALTGAEFGRPQGGLLQKSGCAHRCGVQSPTGWAPTKKRLRSPVRCSVAHRVGSYKKAVALTGAVFGRPQGRLLQKSGCAHRCGVRSPTGWAPTKKRLRSPVRCSVAHRVGSYKKAVALTDAVFGRPQGGLLQKSGCAHRCGVRSPTGWAPTKRRLRSPMRCSVAHRVGSYKKAVALTDAVFGRPQGGLLQKNGCAHL